MAGYFHLMDAIILALKADADLVTLTKDGLVGNRPNTTSHINKNSIQLRERNPYVAVQIFDTRQQIPDTNSCMQVSRILLYYGAKGTNGHAQATLIGDKLYEMFTCVDNGSKCCNRGFFDFSNNNLTNHNTNFIRRFGADFEQNADVWQGRIDLEIIWSGCTCVGDADVPNVPICEADGGDCPSC